MTAVRLLASAMFYDGKFTQAIPMYGTERRGAPVVAFLRIGTHRINERDLVHEPDIVVVLDPLLGRTVDVTEGLKENGLVLINHPKSGKETGLGGKFKVSTVDATGIALETLGRPITNTAILGAFAKITGLVTLESLEKAVMNQWSSRIADMNVKAVRASFERVNQPIDVSDVEPLDVKAKTSRYERDVSSWRVFRPDIDEEKCVGCRRCYIFCPEVAISMEGDKAKIDYTACKGCGVCAEECPSKAISYTQEKV